MRGTSPYINTRVLPVRVLTRWGTVTPQVRSQPSYAETGGEVNRAYVVVANFSHEPLIIPKFTVIGVAEPVSEATLNLVTLGKKAERSSLQQIIRRKVGLSVPKGETPNRARIVKIRASFPQGGNERF